MSKADEMFEKLGYELMDEKICPHSYRYNKNISRFNIKEIILEKANKLITICYYKVDVHGNMESLNSMEYHLSMQELQAINEKVGELRMDRIIEIWKDIPKYEGLYQASNLGNIKSLKRYKQNHSKLQLVNEKVLSKHINKTNGYEYVVLTKNGIEKNIRVHRLIANTFIPNLNNLPQVNHIDGNKQNNRVDNLEWCTNQENIIHAHKNGLAENKNKIQVNQYDLEGNLLNTYESIVEASKKTGTSIGNISLCLKNKRKTANRYIWKTV